MAYNSNQPEQKKSALAGDAVMSERANYRGYYLHSWAQSLETSAFAERGAAFAESLAREDQALKQAAEAAQAMAPVAEESIVPVAERAQQIAQTAGQGAVTETAREDFLADSRHNIDLALGQAQSDVAQTQVNSHDFYLGA